MSIRRRTYKNKNGTLNVYYLASIRLSDGKEIAKQFERKIDAQNWEAEQRRHRDPSLIRFEKQTISLKELSDYWVENYAAKRKEGSSKIRDEIMLRHQILPFFGSKRLIDLNPVDVEAWQQRLVIDKGLAPKTCNNCLGLLKKMLNDAVRWRFIRYNPIAMVTPLPLDEQDFNFWTPDECRKFLEYAKVQNLKAYYAVGIGLYTGMRRGEIQGLKWDCVDFNLKQITVKRTFCLKEKCLKEKTKNKRIRRVPINESLLEIFLELRAKSNSDWVLPNFDFAHAWRTIKRLAEEVGMKPIRFHDTRHTFASNFLMNGGPIYPLQKILGHATIQMTERYSHLSPEHLQGATEILDFGTKKIENVFALRKAVLGNEN